MLPFIVPAIVAATVLGASSAAWAQTPPASQPTPPLAPLLLYYSDGRGDNLTTATADGQSAATAAGYRFARVEGFVFNQQQPETVPLLLYWNEARSDFLTLATAESQNEAQAAGYTFARVEGFVYPTQLPGTVPLQRFFGETRGENLSTATAIGQSDAQTAGYTLARIEGYVVPPGDMTQNTGQTATHTTPAGGSGGGTTTVVINRGLAGGGQSQQGSFGFLPPTGLVMFLRPGGPFGPNFRDPFAPPMGNPGGMGNQGAIGQPGNMGNPAGNPGNQGGNQANAAGGPAMQGGEFCVLANGQRSILKSKNMRGDVASGNMQADYCISGGAGDGKCGQATYSNCSTMAGCQVQMCMDGRCSQREPISVLANMENNARVTRELNPFIGLRPDDKPKSCDNPNPNGPVAGPPAMLDPPCNPNGNNRGPCVDPAKLAGLSSNPMPVPTKVAIAPPVAPLIPSTPLVIPASPPPSGPCGQQAAFVKQVSDTLSSLLASPQTRGNSEIIKAATDNWSKANDDLHKCLAPQQQAAAPTPLVTRQLSIPMAGAPAPAVIPGTAAPSTMVAAVPTKNVCMPATKPVAVIKKRPPPPRVRYINRYDPASQQASGRDGRVGAAVMMGLGIGLGAAMGGGFGGGGSGGGFNNCH